MSSAYFTQGADVHPRDKLFMINRRLSGSENGFTVSAKIDGNSVSVSKDVVV